MEGRKGKNKQMSEWSSEQEGNLISYSGYGKTFSFLLWENIKVSMANR
jgi:hypothetical protein